MNDKRTFIFTVHCDQEYTEHPEFVEVVLSPADIHRLGQAVVMFHSDDFLETVELRLGEIEYYDNDDSGNRIDFDGGAEVGSSYDPVWRTEGERIRIKGNSISVISYDKYGGWIYWSDSIGYAQMKNIDGTYNVPN